jgi:peptide/nickel transport system substrate-binding protein
MVAYSWAQHLVRVFLLGATLVAPIVVPPAHAARQAAKFPTLVVAWNISDAISMDPGHAFQLTNEVVNHSAHDTLVTIDGGDVGHIRPDQVTSWTVSSNSTIFTFKLRRGVIFASGNPLTAGDVVFSY